MLLNGECKSVYSLLKKECIVYHRIGTLFTTESVYFILNFSEQMVYHEVFLEKLRKNYELNKSQTLIVAIMYKRENGKAVVRCY